MSPTRVSPPTLQVPRKRYELSCGAVLLVSSRPGAPVTAVRMMVRGGAQEDPPGQEGTAYLVGRLTDQGTSRHSESELATLLEPAGGEIGGSAGGLSGAMVGDSWRLLAELMVEMAREPRFPDDQVLLQRQRLQSRLAIQEEDPRSMGGRLFRELIYGKHHFGRPTYGTAESLATIGPKQLRAHHARYWRANRVIIGVCGDVDPAAVKRHFEKLTKGWATGEPYKLSEARFPTRVNRVAAFSRQREQVHVHLGHLGIRRKNEAWPALAVMDHVLGSGPGFTSRVTRILRDEQGLAYSVHADIHSSAGLLPGVFSAYIGTSPGHVDTAVKGFFKEIRRIQKELVSKDELEMAKDYLLGSFALGYERASRWASYLVSAEVMEHPEDHLERVPKQYAAITAKDVRDAARAHLHPDACCLAAAGPVKLKQLKELLAR